MGRVVHKIHLTNLNGNIVKAGKGHFVPIYVSEQNGKVTVWYETLHNNKLWTNEYEFVVVSTGKELPESVKYIDSVCHSSGLVWHVYGHWL